MRLAYYWGCSAHSAWLGLCDATAQALGPQAGQSNRHGLVIICQLQGWSLAALQRRQHHSYRLAVLTLALPGGQSAEQHAKEIIGNTLSRKDKSADCVQFMHVHMT